MITGNNYVIYENQSNKIIGYLGLSPIVDTGTLKTVTVYYAILKEYYGHGYGKQVLNEISFLLQQYTPVDVIIANVDRNNSFGIRTIERASFHAIDELSDDEEVQYHRYL